jgi:hypothetical protein
MVLVGKPGIMRLLGRPKHTWEDNIKMDVQKVMWGVMDWIDVGTCKLSNEPSGSIKCRKFQEKLRTG